MAEKPKKHISNCDICMHYSYDEEYDCYDCEISMDMDEDDYSRLSFSSRSYCPYYRPGDEYTIVRKQN